MAISLGFLQFFKHDFPCMKKMDASASFSAGGLERWMPMAMGKWTLRTWICAPSAVSAYLETYLETIQFPNFHSQLMCQDDQDVKKNTKALRTIGSCWFLGKFLVVFCGVSDV